MFILSWSWMNWSFSILEEYSWFLSDKRSTIFCGFFVLARAKNMKITWNSSDGSCSLFLLLLLFVMFPLFCSFRFVWFCYVLVLFLFLRTANFREWKHSNQFQGKKSQSGLVRILQIYTSPFLHSWFIQTQRLQLGVTVYEFMLISIWQWTHETTKHMKLWNLNLNFIFI